MEAIQQADLLGGLCMMISLAELRARVAQSPPISMMSARN